MRKNKYRAVKTTAYGFTFDSKKEASRYIQLRQLEVAGVIKDLKTQVPYKLTAHGVHICKYIADFTYFDVKQDKSIVEDVKSSHTATLPMYRLKKKLLKAEYNIDIQEV